MKELRLGAKIPDSTIVACDGITEAVVYLGSPMFGMKRVEPVWTYHNDRFIEFRKTITLKEIADQYKDKTRIITVFICGAKKGAIFQYGNYGNWWVYYGEMFGYW